MRFSKPSEDAAVDALAETASGAAGADPAASGAGLLRRLRETGALDFTIVAERAGASEPLGFVAFSTGRVSRGAVSADVGLAAGLAVAAVERGRGLGTALLRAGLTQCRKRGLAAALVNQRHRVFERCGFVACHPDRLLTPWAGRVVMGLALSDGMVELSGEATWPPAFFPPAASDEG